VASEADDKSLPERRPLLLLVETTHPVTGGATKKSQTTTIRCMLYIEERGLCDENAKRGPMPISSEGEDRRQVKKWCAWTGERILSGRASSRVTMPPEEDVGDKQDEIVNASGGFSPELKGTSYIHIYVRRAGRPPQCHTKISMHLPRKQPNWLHKLEKDNGS